jgi:hypothetical protein
MLSTSTLNGFQRPSDLDYKSLRTWYFNNAPLVAVEQEAVTWKGDIYTLRHGPDGSGIESKLSDLLRIYDSRILRVRSVLLLVFNSDTPAVVIQAGSTDNVDNRSFHTVVLAIQTSKHCQYYHCNGHTSTYGGSDLHHVQVIKYGHRTEDPCSTGVLMIFSLIFAATMSMLTMAKRHEVFAATAIYCAVLIVFIGSQTK